ncbi:MAG: BrnA antitoxin family protein [Candidatus Accumulibacter sp.]|jgi:uncharacterized protein (DUF4415 family)|nr:BrnA antitoxin family protein [Accumulibacter sp.]
MKTVSHDADKLPPDPTREARFAALSARPDSEIDLTDIPEADAAFWASAVRMGRGEKPKKRQTTIRLDEDVIEWFKLAGRGYQSRINAILRVVMLRDAKKSSALAANGLAHRRAAGNSPRAV